MTRNKKIAVFLLVVVTVFLNIALLQYKADYVGDTKTIYVDVNASVNEAVKLYFANDKAYSEEAMIGHYYTDGTGFTILKYDAPMGYQDFIISSEASLETNGISDIYCYYYFNRVSLMDDCNIVENEDGSVFYVLENGVFQQIVNEAGYKFQKVMNLVFCVILDIAILIVAKYMFQLLRLAREIYQNRVMIMRLAKNDFKTRFAGSYLGIFWAFVQPVVNVLVYWFVFQVGFRSAPVGNFPYVLWLTAGMVPWFFFSEAWTLGTNSLMDYSYLVKKVVFSISTIPVVKVIASIFIHVFFVCFMLLIYMLYGYMPTIYWVQLIYYSFCTLALVLALSYLCSAITVFFKDLTQIIGVVLQIGIWMSCIMWSVDMLAEKVRWIMYFNPVYYIVSGYRNSLISNVWFWETPYQTLGFWIFVALLMSAGFNVFNKLRVHFADVL